MLTAVIAWFVLRVAVRVSFWFGLLWIVVAAVLFRDGEYGPSFVSIVIGFPFLLMFLRRPATPKAIPAQSTVPVVQGLVSLLHRGWCRDHEAVNANGVPVRFDDLSAVAWSLGGAVAATAEYGTDSWWSKVKAVKEVLRERYGTSNVIEWNKASQRTASEVVEVAQEVERRCTQN
jgi:hypothetical protein